MLRTLQSHSPLNVHQDRLCYLSFIFVYHHLAITGTEHSNVLIVASNWVTLHKSKTGTIREHATCHCPNTQIYIKKIKCMSSYNPTWWKLMQRWDVYFEKHHSRSRLTGWSIIVIQILCTHEYHLHKPPPIDILGFSRNRVRASEKVHL